ncbi:MAG: DUF3052 family protein [Dehalococcoidia bacterium]|nr:DUF3052 family protein [Dehalococcoidia bacterium]
MGRLAVCSVRFAGQASEGRALLESKELVFRGDFRLTIPLATITSVHAEAGVLTVAFSGETAEFDVGKAALKWVEAILHPPTLLQKLGLKPGVTCAVAGAIPDDLLADLPPQVEGDALVDLLFFGATAVADLKQLPALMQRVTGGGAIWVVYPKKVQVIRELDVLEAGRTEGLVDTKVVSVSNTHAGLRFSRRRGT